MLCHCDKHPKIILIELAHDKHLHGDHKEKNGKKENKFAMLLHRKFKRREKLMMENFYEKVKGIVKNGFSIKMQ